MKTLFLTTGLVVSVLTTSVFGAASVRMGSTGMASGGGTLTTARAGSLRTAPSSKTVSSAPSTPSVSIASPSQNTNARLSFLSPVKGLDINKAKENATTKQELNDLGEQIEQLRTQLDAAEADSANKIKLEDVERKITEKITELGTSTTAKDTYSKAEVDILLRAIDRKLPTVDDRGNINWTEPNSGLVSIIRPYSFLVANQYYGGLVHDTHYDLISPGSVSSVPREWIKNLCPQTTGNSVTNPIACELGATTYDGETLTGFDVVKCYRGYYQTGLMKAATGIHYEYITFENLSDAEVTEHFCGTSQSAVNSCRASINHNGNAWSENCKAYSISVDMTYVTESGGTENAAPLESGDILVSMSCPTCEDSRCHPVHIAGDPGEPMQWACGIVDETGYRACDCQVSVNIQTSQWGQDQH